MNTTPTHFLVFDPAEQKWLQTTLEELTMRNDSDLYVMAVYENGEQGEQCTWAEYPAKQKEYELSKKSKWEREREEKMRKWEAQKEREIKKQQEEAEAFKRKQEEESREVMATSIRTMSANIEALKNDVLETNIKVRAVCIILLISWAIGAIGIIFGFVLPNLFGNKSEPAPVTPPTHPTPPRYYQYR